MGRRVDADAVALSLIHDEIAALPNDVPLASSLPSDSPGENGLDRECAFQVACIEALAGAREQRVERAGQSLPRTGI